MISAIIPTLNEAERILVLVDLLNSAQQISEIIIVDSPISVDNIKELVGQYPKVYYMKSPVGSRAVQLNLGARQSKESILYFIHADTLPPEDFDIYISDLLAQEIGYGFFSYQFNVKSFILKFNAMFTRFRNIFEGGGDQSLFISKDLFQKVGGYDENFRVMEDFDLIRRLKKTGIKPKLIKKNMTVSARKYKKNPYVKVNLVNAIMFFLFTTGAKPEQLHKAYNYLNLKK